MNRTNERRDALKRRTQDVADSNADRKERKSVGRFAGMCFILLKWKRAACGALCATVALVALGWSTRGLAQSGGMIDEPSSAFIYNMLANVATQSTVDPFGTLSFSGTAGNAYYVDDGYYRGQSAGTTFNGVFDRDFTDGWPDSAKQTYYAPSVKSESNFNKSAWISPSYGQFVVKGRAADPSDRTNTQLGDFRATRTGGEFGFYWSTRDERSQFGLLGSYAQGRMTQSLQNNPYNDYDPGYKRYEINDVQNVRASLNYTECRFGAHLKHEFYNGVRVDACVLGGVQDYGMQRYVSMTWDGRFVDTWYTPEQLLDPTIPDWAKYYKTSGSYNGHFSGNLNGNTLSAMIRVSKEYDLGNNWLASPIVEVLSAHSWLYKGTETGYDLVEWLVAREDVDVYPTTGFMPYQLTRKVRYSRHTGRVGAQLRYSGAVFTCDVRALYGTQLGGENGPTIYGARAGIDNPTEFNLTDSSYGYGRDSLTLCGGACYTLFTTNATTTRLRGDYATILYRKARKEIVSATLTMTF